MNLRQMTGMGNAQAAIRDDAEPDNTSVCLTTLVDGVSLAMPKVDEKTYSEFRGTAARMALQIPDRMGNAERMVVVRTILHEFEVYRNGVETALHDRQKLWRSLTIRLVRELLMSFGLKTDAASVQPLVNGIEQLTTADDIREYRGLLDGFLELRAAGLETAKISPLKVADTSTHNLNAAGLMGGGAAVEHLRKVLERGGTGFVAIFRLSCLEMVSQRFGLEAVEDCLMAVSAYLTAALHSDDAIFHWSDSSLVAILLGRPNELILEAELRRIVSRNSDINVKIGERSIMLRIPISFDLTPLDKFTSADDLYKLSMQSAQKR
jgi:GGDEF domain-containing protein